MTRNNSMKTIPIMIYVYTLYFIREIYRVILQSSYIIIYTRYIIEECDF